jgi:hypothetical protein
MNRTLVFALASCAAFAVAQGAFAQEYYGPESLAPPAPPPVAREDLVPVPPEGAVWVQGHYEWNGRNYFWVGGHYTQPSEAGLYWEPGRWVDRYGRWEWIAGHWRR